MVVEGGEVGREFFLTLWRDRSDRRLLSEKIVIKYVFQ